MAVSKGTASNAKVDGSAATLRRANDKTKGAGPSRLPKRGDIKKGIAINVMRAFARWTPTWKHTRVAPVRDE